MSYVDFLQGILEEGRVAVSPPAPVPQDEIARADAVLVAFEQRYRLEMPGEPPPLHLPAARWAGFNFYHACRFVVHRDADAAALEAMLQSGSSAAATAAAHYSVDLVFRFLPDLMRMANQAAPDDPLVARLQHWAHSWPLSSVGMPGIEATEIDAIVDCPSLMILYVDRIFASGDRQRLQDERVMKAAQCAVGAYPELAGQLAPLLTAAGQPSSAETP